MQSPDFESLLQGAAKEHGHLCAGQAIGVRMAMLGLKLLGLENARDSQEIKKLIVFVEIDRCAADAIAYVTGVKLGRRSLKFKDYGVMAATFVNLETHKAFRIISTETAREFAAAYATHIHNEAQQQLEAYKSMPLNVLFDLYEVQVDVAPHDLPGSPTVKVLCERCGTMVRDGKEVRHHAEILCRYCAGQSYYRRPVKIPIEPVDIYGNDLQIAQPGFPRKLGQPGHFPTGFRSPLSWLRCLPLSCLRFRRGDRVGSAPTHYL